MSDSLSAAVQQLQPAPVQHFRPYKIDLLTGATNWYQWRNLQVQVLRTHGTVRAHFIGHVRCSTACNCSRGPGYVEPARQCGMHSAHAAHRIQPAPQC